MAMYIIRIKKRAKRAKSINIVMLVGFNYKRIKKPSLVPVKWLSFKMFWDFLLLLVDFDYIHVSAGGIFRTRIYASLLHSFSQLNFANFATLLFKPFLFSS